MTEDKTLTLAEECAQGKERRARVEAEEKAVADAKRQHEENVASKTRNVNTEYFAKQEELAKQAAEQNAKNAASQKQRDKDGVARRIAENEAARSYRGPNKPPEGFLDIYGTVPAPRNPSIVLQTQPDPDVLARHTKAVDRPLTEQEKKERQERAIAHFSRHNR